MGRCGNCRGQVSSKDVYYEGPYLPNLGVQQSMNLNTILSIFNTLFQQIGIVPIKLIAQEGTTITSPDLQNKTVLLIVIDDITKNTGFTKIASSPTITFTDGTSLVNGQVITIFAS